MRLLAAIALLALAGCEDRRTFDERYSDTEEKLEEKAHRLDNQLANEATANSAEPGPR